MPLKTQIKAVYTLTVVYNFINIYNLNDLDSFPIIKDKEINNKNGRLIDKKSDIGNRFY